MCNFGLTVSQKMAKISAVGRKSHHPIETQYTTRILHHSAFAL